MVNIKPRKKSRKNICLDKSLWATIDLQANSYRMSRSAFIEWILKTVLGSTKSFLEFRLIDLARKYNYAKFEAENYNSEGSIKAMLERLRAGR